MRPRPSFIQLRPPRRRRACLPSVRHRRGPLIFDSAQIRPHQLARRAETFDHPNISYHDTRCRTKLEELEIADPSRRAALALHGRDVEDYDQDLVPEADRESRELDRTNTRWAPSYGKDLFFSQSSIARGFFTLLRRGGGLECRSQRALRVFLRSGNVY